ncbi:NAD-dependent dihydropyrimidine dehydrogenase subunit PreA [Cellulophaga baltica]|uniref:NAD-dependent dihydropyrimidine dehydrogenase subunit PreA n=1 Tax=Cellulophaga TaxID=104264 RepID=UPI001C07C2AF|nr:MULTISPECIES: NAD-dependent dihydropyrimidine dehydrogenase subunit PreA [Cellulophaga]MBU2996667.1 NAD-dependent dihydropyrimidine dehydrogenase subunit PreA [Cellulophaga baltica]MDO6768061.1 NAD-dependent dihydropyrimidine dehydrogenase subunit PreA [Cellulophaga sp. 1_MG-2023]
MADLSVNFAGIKAPNPFWLASAPPTNSGYQIIKAFEAGWGGAVWKTLGLPTINVSSRYGAVNYGNTRMAGFNNIELISDRPLVDNLREMEEVKKHFPDHAVIASLMVDTREQWIQIIKDVENAGADGIELNFGCPHGMCERGMGSAVGQDPVVLKTIVEWVMDAAKIPVITKLSPNISHITDPGLAAAQGGTDAISLVNTFKSIVGIDLDSYAPYPVVDGKGSNGGYCGPAVKPIALNMVKELAQHKDINHLPISGIGGIETWRDAVEFILLGATSLQVCTAAMHYGFGIVREMEAGLTKFMDERGYNTIYDFAGKALPNVTEWKNLNLKYNVKAEINEDKCVGCDLCYIACDDGAHQAIALPLDGSRIPSIIDENCVGCNLCSLVCPVEDCITMVRTDDGKENVTWQQLTDKDEIPSTFNDKRAGGNGHYVPEPSKALRSK